MYLRKCFWLGLLIYLERERERERVFFVGFFYNVIFYLKEFDNLKIFYYNLKKYFIKISICIGIWRKFVRYINSEVYIL